MYAIQFLSLMKTWSDRNKYKKIAIFNILDCISKNSNNEITPL